MFGIQNTRSVGPADESSHYKHKGRKVIYFLANTPIHDFPSLSPLHPRPPYIYTYYCAHTHAQINMKFNLHYRRRYNRFPESSNITSNQSSGLSLERYFTSKNETQIHN